MNNYRNTDSNLFNKSAEIYVFYRCLFIQKNQLYEQLSLTTNVQVSKLSGPKSTGPI